MSSGTEVECGSCGSIYWLRTDIQDCDCPYCRIADLEREVQELRQDKRRLDWLESVHQDGTMIVPAIFSSPFLCSWKESQPLRQAIDAAMENERLAS